MHVCFKTYIHLHTSAYTQTPNKHNINESGGGGDEFSIVDLKVNNEASGEYVKPLLCELYIFGFMSCATRPYAYLPIYFLVA